MLNWAPALALTFALPAAVVQPRATASPITAPGAEAPGSDITAFDAIDLEGQRWTAGQFRGRVVLIDFWATWCAPCLAELPRLKELRGRYTRDELEIVGVMLDVSSRRSVVSWLNRNRIDWPQIHERRGYNGKLPTAFGVRELPATVLVDGTGTIVATGLRGEALSRQIDELVSAGAAGTGAGSSARGLLAERNWK